jgi:acyl-CoA dehydrogenase
MKYVMQNFNHERLSISIGVNRLSRVAISSAFEYCLKREAFGKPLMDQAVVRHRLAKCGAELVSGPRLTGQKNRSGCDIVDL